MAQKLLYTSQIRPGIKEMRRITVTKLMRGQRWVEPGDGKVFLEAPSQVPGTDRRELAGLREEDGGLAGRRSGQGAPVVVEGFQGRRWGRASPFGLCHGYATGVRASRGRRRANH